MTHWTESVDYYLDHDHRARRRHFFRATAVGAVVGMACATAHLPQWLCYSMLFLAVAITSCVLLYFYVKDKDRP